MARDAWQKATTPYALPPGGKDEIGELVDSFNLMAGRIAQAQEAELRATRQSCREIIESAPDGMLVVNATGQIVLANHQLEVIFGYARVSSSISRSSCWCRPHFAASHGSCAARTRQTAPRGQSAPAR